jgi:hypothetical protein
MQRIVVIDRDPQGSSMRWLRKRPDDAPPIHGSAVFERSAMVRRSWQMRIPADCGTVIIDTPAAIDAHALPASRAAPMPASLPIAYAATRACRRLSRAS